MNGTRMGDQFSADNFNSNFDATSMEDESRFDVNQLIGGAAALKNKGNGRAEAAIGYEEI